MATTASPPLKNHQMKTPAKEQDQARALLREGFASFEAFCGLLDIIPKDGRRQKFRLNPIQRIYCANRTFRDVILKPRQVGMTTLEQARDVWHFLTRPGARVTMMVQSISDADSPARKARRVFDLMFESLRNMGLLLNFDASPGGVWVLKDRDAVLRIVEAGASKAAASKKGRGDTVTRLHVTEQAFWEHAEESLLAVESSVVSPEDGGEITKESTPNGAGGKFYNDVQNARAGYSSYKLHFYPWHFEPKYRVALDPGEVIEPETERERQLADVGVSPEALKWYRRTVGDRGSQTLVDQEFVSDPDSCFLLSGRPFFSIERLEEMRTKAQKAKAIEVLDYRTDGAAGQLRIWKAPKPGARYVLALDPSEGTGGDRGAGFVYERGTGEHCATLHGQFKPHALARAGVGVATRYNHATIAPERNNHGHAVILSLVREQRYPHIFRDRDNEHGWITTETSRTEALSILDKEIRDGKWTTPDQEVLGELRTFVINKRGKAEASTGSYDDLVMVGAIGLDVVRKPEPPRGQAPTHTLGIL